MSKTLSSRFLAAIGINSGQEKKTDNAALVRERDEAVAKFDKAADAYAELEKELTDAKAAHEKEITDAKAAHSMALTAVTKERDDLKASRDEWEKTTRERIKNEEVATITGAQGVPPEQTPPAGKAGGDGKAGEIASLTTQINAEKDPSKKGELITKLKALRDG